jgi:hypothetical protein
VRLSEDNVITSSPENQIRAGYFFIWTERPESSLFAIMNTGTYAVASFRFCSVNQTLRPWGSWYVRVYEVLSGVSLTIALKRDVVRCGQRGLDDRKPQ